MSDSIEMIIYEKIKKEILLGTIDQEKNYLKRPYLKKPAIVALLSELR